jgi:hypothetical protein
VFQVEIIFDDAVVHDDDFAGAVAVRVGVFFGRAPVGGLTRVADAVDALERALANRFFEISQLAGGAANVELAVLGDYGDSGGIIAAIFQAAQAVQNERDDFFIPDVTNDSAHSKILPEIQRSTCDVAATGAGSMEVPSAHRLRRRRFFSSIFVCFAFFLIATRYD